MSTTRNYKNTKQRASRQLVHSVPMHMNISKLLNARLMKASQNMGRNRVDIIRDAIFSFLELNEVHLSIEELEKLEK